MLLHREHLRHTCYQALHTVFLSDWVESVDIISLEMKNSNFTPNKNCVQPYWLQFGESRIKEDQFVRLISGFFDESSLFFIYIKQKSAKKTIYKDFGVNDNLNKNQYNDFRVKKTIKNIT